MALFGFCIFCRSAKSNQKYKMKEEKSNKSKEKIIFFSFEFETQQSPMYVSMHKYELGSGLLVIYGTLVCHPFNEQSEHLFIIS